MCKVILSNCLMLFVIGVASSTDRHTRSTLSDCVTPIEYSTTLFLNITNYTLHVKSEILLKVTCVTERITVYKKRCGGNINVIHFSFNHSPVYTKKLIQAEGETYHMSIYKGTPKRLTHEVDMPPDVYVMSAYFLCPLDCKDCFFIFPYRNYNNEEKKVLVSHNQNSGIAWTFPFWNDRTKKAKFLLTIEHDTGYYAVSHMALPNISESETGMTTTFKKSPAISTNQVAVALVPQGFVEVFPLIDDVFSYRISLRCRGEIRKHVSYALPILEKVTRELDRSNQRIKNKSISQVQYLAVPNYERSDYQRITATPGLVFLRESDITYNKQQMLPMKEIQVQLAAASSAVYHMFAEQFNVEPREYTWFYEMFIKYFAFNVLHQNSENKFKNTRLMNTYVVQSQWELLYIEALNTNSLPDDIRNFSFSFLDKIIGFRALRMLELSDVMSLGNIFMRVLDTALASSLSGNKDVNVWSIINTTIDKMIAQQLYNTLELGVQLSDPTLQWISTFDKRITHNYFGLEVKRNYSTGSVIVKMSNCFSRTIDNHCNIWYIPVMFITESVDQPGMFWIKPNRSYYSGNFPITDYLIVNVQQTAYFRVNYDLENWKKIPRYLNSTSKRKDPVTCAQLLDDAFYFLVRHARDHSDVHLFFEIASYLERQMDYASWYPMMNALEYLSSYFPFDKDKTVTNKVLKILNGFLATTLYDQDMLQKNSDTLSYQLRYEVLKWACTLKDVKCKEHIKNLMKLHVRNPSINRLMSGWEEWLYCQGLQIENVSYKRSQIWHFLYRENDSLTTKQLQYLTCSKNDENIYDSLCLVREQSNTLINHSDVTKHLQGKKMSNDFLLLLAKHSDKNIVLELLLYFITFQETSLYTVERSLAVLTVIINNIYSPQPRRTMEYFISDIHDEYITLNTKYKKTVITEALAEKLTERPRFKWMEEWMYNRKK